MRNRIELQGEVIKETDMAWLFDCEHGEIWLPKSQCEWDEDTQTMWLTRWIAREKDLI